MAANIEKIRRAVLANRGGFENATDGQIMTIWTALNVDTQIKYLASIKQTDTKSKGKKNADGT